MGWKRGLAALWIVAFAATAEARSHWPQPAAGESASGDPEIIFTFDDGPHERWSAPLLDVLDAHHVKGLFFWTGWRVRRDAPMHNRRKDIIARALADGHAVGNHTVNHVKLCSIPEEEAEMEIDENRAIMERLTGLPMIFFRAPYGSRCRRLEGMLADRGIDHLHWDMDPQEWEHHDADTIREYLQDRIRRLEGRAVILLHDTKPSTARALDDVLTWITAENARRRARGLGPIRILSYADLAREAIPPRVREAVDTTFGRVMGFVPEIAGGLLAPLAPPAPVGPAVAVAGQRS